jgi:deoxyribose-phosphate aldolase
MSASHPSTQELIQKIADATHAIATGTGSEPSVTEGRTVPVESLAGMIDHTLLKPDATRAQIERLCAEARQYQFASVCVNPTWVELCREQLTGSPVRVCTVAGFALGATLATVKAYETEQVIALGAQEVDMVINIGALKDRNYDLVYADIAGVVAAAHAKGVVVKSIIETFLLSQEEKIAACVIAQAAGVDFVKTSTGFNGGGATVEDVRLMRRVVGPDLGVKAAGGVRNVNDAMQMIAAGATRIGASAGVQIVQSALNGESSVAGSVAPTTASQQGIPY